MEPLTLSLVIGGAVLLGFVATRKPLPPGVKGPTYKREVTGPSGNTYRTTTWTNVITEFPFGGDPVFTRAESIAIPGLWVGYWHSRVTDGRKLWVTHVPDKYDDRASTLVPQIQKDFGL